MMKTYSWWVRLLWGGALSVLVFVVLLFMYISYFKMPDTKKLENPYFEQSSIVYGDNQEEIGRFYNKNRKWLDYNQISPFVKKALVATEDVRFFEHSGVDFRGTLRAAFSLGKEGGASTITQQLAKQFFSKGSKNKIVRVYEKMQEWVIATQFEKRYTKEEILTMYLNKFDFLYGAIGVSSAAKIYFGKEQRDLTITEAATLIGMLKNPVIYNPVRNTENAFNRKNVVLGQLKKSNYITEKDYIYGIKKQLDISKFISNENYASEAPYFQSVLNQRLKKILDDPKYYKADGTPYDLYEDGLKIYTTINLPMQRHAESAAKAHTTSLQKRFFARWRGVDLWRIADKSRTSKLKEQILWEAVLSSSRFDKLMSHSLGNLIAEIDQDFPQRSFQYIDIDRLIKQEANGDYLNMLYKKNFIDRASLDYYDEIIKSVVWQKLKIKYLKAVSKVRLEFNRPVKMKINTFSDEGMREVVMSPLDSIKFYLSFLQIGSVAIEPQTGYVKTWVGGIDFGYFKYDHVTSFRQVGSTFKPFLYAKAIESGFSPCFTVVDKQYEVPANDPQWQLSKSWVPSNADGEFSYNKLTLKDGLKNSVNSVAAYLMIEMGSADPLRDYVANIGIDKSKIPSVPSLALGAGEVPVLNMTAAYSCFSNHGVYTEPTLLLRIEDNNGKVIFNFHPESHQGIDPETNYAMVEMLKYATSNHSSKLSVEFGGKTGTTNNYVDGWFMGITPKLVVGTWVGGDHTWLRFNNMREGQGAVLARPYFFDFMRRIENDPTTGFNRNDRFMFNQKEMTRELDCGEYLLPDSLYLNQDEFELNEDSSSF